MGIIKVMKAATILHEKPQNIFVATNTDEQFPSKSGVVIPGTGTMVNAVATAAGRRPVIMGKPSPSMFEEVAKQFPEIDRKRTVMIGDRCNTDILLGKNCGLQTLMVGSGVHRLEQVREWEKSSDPEENRLVPDFYVDKLGDLLEYL